MFLSLICRSGKLLRTLDQARRMIRREYRAMKQERSCVTIVCEMHISSLRLCLSSARLTTVGLISIAGRH